MDDLARRIAKLSPQQRALLELQLQKKKGWPDPIAIVGIGCRFPGAPIARPFGICCGRAPMPLPRFPPIAGIAIASTTPTPPHRAKPTAGRGAFWTGWISLIRPSSALPPAKPPSWTPSSGCFWRWCGRPWRMRPSPPNSSAVAPPGCLWGCPPTTMANGCWRGQRRWAPTPPPG